MPPTNSAGAVQLLELAGSDVPHHHQAVHLDVWALVEGVKEAEDGGRAAIA
jgi:hypothetical protein